MSEEGSRQGQERNAIGVLDEPFPGKEPPKFKVPNRGEISKKNSLENYGPRSNERVRERITYDVDDDGELVFQGNEIDEDVCVIPNLDEIRVKTEEFMQVDNDDESSTAVELDPEKLAKRRQRFSKDFETLSQKSSKSI